MLCVLCDTLVLNCMMFPSCVGEAYLAMLAFVAFCPLAFRMVHHVVDEA